MNWSRAARYLLPAIWTFIPMYGVERLADYYFLSDNLPAFYGVSGWRLVLFIAVAVVGSIAAGVVVAELKGAAIAEIAGLAGFLIAAYALCDPRVCYSTGPQGLEPLRFGFFLGSVTTSGSALGVSMRRKPLSRLEYFVTSFAGFAAFGFYPVIFTFAGTKLFSPFFPWGAALLLAVAAVSISVTSSLTLGVRWGFVTPLLSLGVLSALSSGIATVFIGSIAPDLAVFALIVAVSAATGALLIHAKRPFGEHHRSWFSGAFAAGLILVLLMMLLLIPDAVNGVVPNPNGSPSSFVTGTPVYLGGYMDAPAGHALGAEATVSFAGTNSSSIQQGNFLSGGLGIHAAGCCVDGIDYSYRFDLYLFHDGSESLVAEAWQACDDNAACGGHSWEVLMFLEAKPLQSAELNDNVTLRMEWVQSQSGTSVSWTYSVSGGTFTNFTSFFPPSSENRDFNTGVLPGGTPTAAQSGSYFFQFGIMSRYPIGHGGWTVTIGCPAVLVAGWGCVPHARTLMGDQSFWKVFWRWGENYPDATAVASGPGRVVFGFSSTLTTGSFQSLW